MNLIENLSHPIVHALSWSLIHSIWQISLIVLLWRVILYFVSGSSALFRYRLSLLAFFAVPASFFYTFARQWQTYSNARQIISIETDTGAVLPAAYHQRLFLLEQGRPAFLEGLDALSPVIFWVYVTGILIVASFSFFSYRKIYRLKKHSTLLPENWSRIVSQLVRRTQLSSSLPVRMSEHIDIPLVVGFLKPVVLLPAAMLFSMTTEQVESIVMHELYHIRRRDHVINMIQHLFEILFFYHPAIWWIGKKVREAREESVDEWVVGQIARPADYAQALLHIEQSRAASMPQPMVAATQSKNHLFTRIKHMMTMKTRSLNTGQKMATTLAIILAFATVAWVRPSAPDQPDLASPDSHAYNPMEPINLEHFAEQEQAPDSPPPPPAYLAYAEPDLSSMPFKVHLDDGTQVEFEGLSEKDKEKIMKAIEEVGIALKQVREEILREMDSEEFKEEMQQAREEIRQAMQELNAVDWDSLMYEVGKAVNTGMEAFHKGMQSFHEGMQILQKELQEMGPALQEMLKELEAEMQELEKEMQEPE